MSIDIPDISQLPNDLFNFITKDNRQHITSVMLSNNTQFKIDKLYKKDNNWIQQPQLFTNGEFGYITFKSQI